MLPCEFENCFHYLCEECCWRFDGDCAESVHGFPIHIHFMLLILTIHKQCFKVYNVVSVSGDQIHDIVCTRQAFY